MSSADMDAILARTDRLEQMDKRRFQGDFFTPLAFAKLGLDYIEKVLGPNWYKEYKIWDMACGTGNLEYHIPTYENVFMSTIDTGEVSYLKSNNMFPGATIFQYDYLNDDVELVMSGADLLDDKLGWKLPRKLREALADKANKWVVLMNPPYATSQEAGATSPKATSGENKKGVSNTAVRKIMHEQGLGEVSRELFDQFLYRATVEARSCNMHIGLFSTIKYINANNDQKFRDKVFHYQFKDGFVFSSSNFSGTSKQNPFPICFMIWNLTENKKLEDQNIEIDVLDEQANKTFKKKIDSKNRRTFLSKWVNRPTTENIFPPFSSALTIKKENKDIRDRIAKGFIASFMCNGNDVRNQNSTAFLSGPCASAGAFSVTSENFEKSVTTFSVRKVIPHTWINHQDQFCQSNSNFSDDFINDCAAWTLFDSKNQTASIKDVEYKGTTYQVRNQFFPYLLSELREWDTPHDLSGQLRTAQDTFVANWLKGRALSAEAQTLLDAGRKVYQVFYKEWKNLNLRKFKIDYYDCGWYQIRNALLDAKVGLEELNAVKEAHTKLALKLRPKVYDYGFLDHQ